MILLEHLLKRFEFLAVAKEGKRVATPAFILQAHKARSDEIKRFGVVATRKIGGAVQRNRAKRRLRALANAVLIDQGLPGYDYVFVARGEILKRNFAQMRQELENALTQIHKE